MDARTVIRMLKTPVTLILLVVFVVAVTRWALNEVRKPIPERPLDPCVVTDVGPELTADKVFVRVYNGTETSGLGRRLAATLRADGFTVFKIANTDTPDATTSEVVGGGEDNPEVVLIRQAFQSIAFRSDGRNDATVDVIIGAQQPVLLADPQLSVPLPDGKACLAQVEIFNSGE